MSISLDLPIWLIRITKSNLNKKGAKIISAYWDKSLVYCPKCGWNDNTILPDQEDIPKLPFGYRFLKDGETTQSSDLEFHTKPSRWEKQKITLEVVYDKYWNVPMARKGKRNEK